MKKEYDFSNAKRGPVIPAAKNKERITIRIDSEILAWFRKQAHAQSGGSYQTAINHALGEYITSRSGALENTLRKVLREELAAVGKRK